MICLSVTECPQLAPKIEIHRCQQFFSKSNEMFITDVSALKSVHGTKCAFHLRELMFGGDEAKPATSGHLDTQELVKLLQQSAVERLTTFRQLQAQKFGSEFTIVTTDFEALYAYKCGEYHRCLQLSKDNVRTLSSSHCQSSDIYVFPELMQLMDDDTVSLTGLMLIANPACRELCEHTVKQLSLSLYLMTRCQIKLRHSMTSLTQTLDYIEVTRHKPGIQKCTLDQLLLKLAERKILLYITPVISD